VLGHSLGEYAALVASGVIRFDEAVRLVQKRGQHMQEAVPEGEGGMAAIMGLTDEELEQVCVSVTNLSKSGLVEAANYNAPGQVVVAGDLETLNSLIEKCKDLGARRAIMLKVSAPFHCSLMEPAAEKMKLHLEKVDLLPPEIPLIQNVSAGYEREPEVLRSNLVEQIRKPVKWADSVRLLEEEGVLDFVECGPGKVLSGLVKRTNRAATCVSFGSELELADLSVFGGS
jgi:[acyl-carrier-protein] S-malonyltransferase